MRKTLLILIMIVLGGAMTLRAQTYMYDFEDGIQNWTTIDADGDGDTWLALYYDNNPNGIPGHNGSEGHVTSASYSGVALTPDNYLVSPLKAAYTSITFYACAQDNAWAAEHFGVEVSTTGNTSGYDFISVQEWTMTAKRSGVVSAGRDGQTREQGTWYEYTVDLSAFEGQEIWVAIRHFGCTDQFRLNVDDVTLEIGGAPSTTITSIYIEDYTAPVLGQNPDFDIYVMAGAHYSISEIEWWNDGIDLEPSDVFVEGVAFMKLELTPESGYEFVEEAVAYFNGDNSIHDAYYNILNADGTLIVYTINYYLTGPQNAITYSFEGSFDGWTTIDADGDGYCWVQASELMAGYTIPSHDGADCLTSESYVSEQGIALNPDNYLVSPEKAAYTEITFWACAQDANWAAEHFGVSVSTGSNSNPADFTLITEWTMTAKRADAAKTAKLASKYPDAKDQGEWYEYNVDFAEYAGQEIWVAIRHFDCYNQFYLNLDEVTLYYSLEGVEENNVNMFSMYPNPANDNVMIESEVSVNRYDIYDITGALVMSNEVNAATFTVNLETLPVGSYIIRLTSDGMIQNRKLIKK